MLRTQTAIRGNKPNMEVHYRFVHSRGERSPFFTARTNRNGLAVVTHNWPVPITRGRERGWLRVEGNAPTDFRSTRVQYSMNCTDAPRRTNP